MLKETNKQVSKNLLERLPFYLNYLKVKEEEGVTNISSPTIASDLNLHEEQVRKDIAMVSTTLGRPRSGRLVVDLIQDIEKFLGYHKIDKAILVGVGHLGQALLSYEGFESYGLTIAYGFDQDPKKIDSEINKIKIYHISKMKEIIQKDMIRIGIITVPAQFAQDVCDIMVEAGIQGIWNFTPIYLNVPENVIVQNENMASSLAVLSRRLSENINK